MPRSNRRRDDRRPGNDEDVEESDLSRLTLGWRRTETRRGAMWNVQPIGASAAQKTYTCPGCGNLIDVGVAHVVVWRADGVLGDDHDLAARRHWHPHCWKTM